MYLEGGQRTDEVSSTKSVESEANMTDFGLDLSNAQASPKGKTRNEVNVLAIWLPRSSNAGENACVDSRLRGNDEKRGCLTLLRQSPQTSLDSSTYGVRMTEPANYTPGTKSGVTMQRGYYTFYA